MIKKLYRLSDEGARKMHISSLILAIFESCCAAALIPIAMLLGELYEGTPISMGKYILIGIAIIAFIYISYYYYYSYKYVVAGAEVADLRMEVADKLRRLPSSYLGKRDISDFTSTIMDDIGTIEGVFANGVVDTLGSVLYAIIILVILGIVNLKLTLCLAACFPLAVLVMSLSNVVSGKTHWRNRKKRLVVSERLQEYLDNIKTLKFSNVRTHYEDVIEKKCKGMLGGLLLFEFLAGLCISTAYNVLRLGFVLVTIVGAKELAAGTLHPVTYLVFLLASFRVYEPLAEATEYFGAVLASHVAMKRITDILDYPEQTGRENVTPAGYDIAFDGVTFGYETEDVVRDVSFVAKQGEYTALVGPSGSGKSTLLRLAARFWDPTEGRVTIGGEDITTIAPEQVFSYFSIVFQDVVLFNDTIYNNIRIGNKNATREQVLRAAHLAQCDSFIEKLPEGIDTMLGENGRTLSGGERQRLSIARAFLKEAPIVLLDESTASLDPETETNIQRAIDNLTREKTVLMIAHRLRSVVNCDKIVVLEDGRVVGDGKHEDLLSNCPAYEKLYRMQQMAAESTMK
ncbi:MAG: ABC transporter ATP-binding protein/permease [Lachnospiraceae bacterium]|nr:ABC transporter ATP-binding protein/permease [Lachnospiraceae bacterium]